MMKFFIRYPLLTRVFVVAAVFVVGFSWFAADAHAASIGNCGGDPGCMFAEALLGVVGKLIALTMVFFSTIFAVILGWVGSMFNYAMLLTVFQFGNYFGNSEGLRIAWGILRDLANIVVLFGFIYIGLMTILDIGNYTAQKTLPTLLIFAALLNFSLFASEAIVDISNAVAANFYAQIGNIDCGSGENNVECANNGIVSHVMHATGINSLHAVNPATYTGIIFNEDGIQQGAIWLGVFLFLVVLIGVLFVGTIMLVSRAVHLVLLFVISPLGFAGFALPFLTDRAQKDWWAPLIKNAIFAPAFVLLVLISLKIVEAVRNAIAPDVSLIDALSSSDASALSVLFIFALTIVFLWQSMAVAEKFGSYGAKEVVGGAKRWIGNTAGGIVLSPVNWGSRLAGNLYNATTGGVRRIPVLGQAATFLGTATGVDSAIRTGLERGKELKLTALGQDKTLREASVERKKRAKEIEEIGDFQKALGRASTGDTVGLKKIVASMDEKTLVAEVERLTPTSAKILASSMSSKQFKAVMDAPKIGTEKKTEMRKARYKSLEEDIQEASDDSDPARQEKARDRLQKNWDAEDFELSEVSKNPQLEAAAVRHMKKEQFDSYIKTLDDKRSQDRAKNIRNGTTGEARFSTQHANAVMGALTRQEFEHILTETPSVLRTPHVVNAMRPRQFQHIQRYSREITDPTVLAAVRTKVQNLFAAADPELMSYLASLQNSQPRALTEFKRFYGLP